MEYVASDSSGTDDDLPPSYQNRGAREGRINDNGRTAVGAPPYLRVQNDMEIQIHLLEQEAYSAVLRAFKAQADAITWEKEGLISELRKELRVSDEEHRELLTKVNVDDIIQRIREWRQGGGLQSGVLNNSQTVHDAAHSPTASASRKRQKTSMSLDAPPPVLHSQGISTSMQPSTAGKMGAVAGPKGKKPKSFQRLPSVSSMKSLQYSSTGPNGREQITNKISGALAASEPAEAAACDALIGRKVWTRWPEDNSFYEAVISEYKPLEGLHALVYDIHTDKETWEWVNLKEISPEDIRWDGEDPGISHQAGQSRPGHGAKKSVARDVGTLDAGRGRGSLKTQSNKDSVLPQNGIRNNGSDDIEILHTQSLIKEVERVYGSSHPDPLEMLKMKKMLKQHEQSLIDAIKRLAGASNGENEGNADKFTHRQSTVAGNRSKNR